MSLAVVIGAGPAGLMAAEVLAKAGHEVIIADQKPSFGRKFLMAGKSGLNLTKHEHKAAFYAAFETEWLHPMLNAFGPKGVQNWARGLGQYLFTGSTGRVFPTSMKASPLLRAWLARLDDFGVERHVRWQWRGWDHDALIFETPDGRHTLTPDVTVLALGGASWRRLGSDGKWTETLEQTGVPLVPFQPANFGVRIGWSDHMKRHFGVPVKNIALSAGERHARGEIIISKEGLEGGGIYAISRGLRDAQPLTLDLLPNVGVDQLTERLSKPKGTMSQGNFLRKAVRLDGAKQALLQEFARPLPDDPKALAAVIKALPIAHQGPRDMDQAISTAGGVAQGAVDAGLMLKARPGTFVVGEMLDWEAPTGGYLLTACLATGHWAGTHADRWLTAS